MMCCESFEVVSFDLRPLLQGQMGSLTFEVDFSRLLLVLEVWDVHPTYRKWCAASLLEWSVLTSDPSFKVKWGHWPFKSIFLAYNWFWRLGMLTQLIGNVVLQVFWSGQTWPWTLPPRSNGVIDHWSWLLVLEVPGVHPTYRKWCAASLLELSDLTLDPSLDTPLKLILLASYSF